MTLPTAAISAAVALLVAGGAQVVGAPAQGAAGNARPVVVVVASPALAADAPARAAIADAGAQLRVPRSPTEQLSVTHLFAARGATVVGAGLDRRVAVDPVAARYPASRFILLAARPSLDRLEAALRVPPR